MQDDTAYVGNESRSSRQLKDFKRAYKACLSCRKTKAKCVIEGNAVSCVKCRRERRDCVFTAERSSKKRKRPADRSLTSQPDRLSVSSFEIDDSGITSEEPGLGKNHNSTYDHQENSTLRNLRSPSRQAPHVSGNYGPSHQHLPHLDTEPLTEHRSQNARQLNTNLDKDVMQTVVSSSNDALGLLFRAAEQQDDDEDDDEDYGSDEQRAIAAMRSHDSPGSALVNRSITPIRASDLSNPSLDVLNLWKHHRFVRQGWFSAQEAVTYLDLFFRNLAPLSPVSDRYYADHKNHKRLILEESLLCCTLIMISSRYHVLPGQGGGSRAEFIHTRMWKHVEHLIQRITFGAEKDSLFKTRSLGSIISLLLITEWHPRAIHFPPETDGWDTSLAPGIDDICEPTERKEDAHLLRWRDEVFEPAKRSDRMSWTLIGLATTLAHELGVFENADTDDEEVTAEVERDAQLRVRRLLFLYVNQLSLRLGCTSILPQTSTQSMAYTPRSHVPPQAQEVHDANLLLSKWMDITKLLKTANDMFFPSKSVTRQILKSGRDFLETNLPTISDSQKQTILLDYSYVRMYINALAIQALVDRANSRSTPNVWLDYDFIRNEYAQDLKFIHEVREASCEILTAAIKLGEAGTLRYCPVRFFSRIVSASVFLLKSISVGARNSEIHNSLLILDRCNNVLRANTHDDIHLSARFGVLMARHVRRFRRNFRVQSGLGTVMKETSVIDIHGSLPSRGTGALPQNFGAVGHTEVPDTFGSLQGNYLDADATIDDWLAQPFDPSIAPFGLDPAQSASGLAIDSLDFLWNLPG